MWQLAAVGAGGHGKSMSFDDVSLRKSGYYA